MFDLKRFVSLTLCVAVTATLAACGTPEDTNSTVSYRQKYTPPVEEQFVDKDGFFAYETEQLDIDGNYVIVFPEGNSENKKSAEYLADYYQNKLDIALEAVSDKTAEKETEILVGATNRKESGKTLKENELVSFVSEKKLVLLGGHTVTTDTAVKKFVRTAPGKGQVSTFSLESDFKSTFGDGYRYVWGDEFEGNKVDRSKFTFKDHMAGTNSIVTSSDEDTIRVEDGRLKMIAAAYFDPQREGTQYKVPRSVTTVYNMNYIYGYAEIRARMPFQSGAWPSFWAKSNESPYLDVSNVDYTVEVDVFEVFGHLTDVVPNIHKWYRTYNYDSIHNVDAGKHTQVSRNNKNVYSFTESKAPSNEYHVYGFEWTPTEISMSVDGNKYQTFDLTKSIDLYDNMKGFVNQPLFLIFNNHVMTEDSSYVTTLIKNSELPTEYDIDYLRLYQKPGQGKLYIDLAEKD